MSLRLHKSCLSLLPLALFACATQSGIWVKSDVTPLQTNQDNYACLQESQQPFGWSQGGYGRLLVGNVFFQARVLTAQN